MAFEALQSFVAAGASIRPAIHNPDGKPNIRRLRWGPLLDPAACEAPVLRPALCPGDCQGCGSISLGCQDFSKKAGSGL
jgi:hypothetical protein